MKILEEIKRLESELEQAKEDFKDKVEDSLMELGENNLYKSDICLNINGNIVISNFPSSNEDNREEVELTFEQMDQVIEWYKQNKG